MTPEQHLIKTEGHVAAYEIITRHIVDSLSCDDLTTRKLSLLGMRSVTMFNEHFHLSGRPSVLEETIS